MHVEWGKKGIEASVGLAQSAHADIIIREFYASAHLIAFLPQLNTACTVHGKDLHSITMTDVSRWLLFLLAVEVRDARRVE